MAGTFPRFRLYQSDGTTLVYEFEKVIDWGNAPFQDPITFSEHTSLRGQGSIISEGSQASYDFTLNFILVGDNYEDLAGQMDNLPSSIVTNTKYVLRIDLDEIGTTKDLKVKRLLPIQFPLIRRQKAVKFQDGIITFRVDSWA